MTVHARRPGARSRQAARLRLIPIFAISCGAISPARPISASAASSATARIVLAACGHASAQTRRPGRRSGRAAQGQAACKEFARGRASSASPTAFSSCRFCSIGACPSCCAAVRGVLPRAGLSDRLHLIIPREVLLCGACLVGSTEVIRKLPGYGHRARVWLRRHRRRERRRGPERAARRHRARPETRRGGRRARRRFARELQQEMLFVQMLEQILEAAANGRASPR